MCKPVTDRRTYIYTSQPQTKTHRACTIMSLTLRRSATIHRKLLEHKPSYRYTLRMYPISKSRITELFQLNCTSTQLESRIGVNFGAELNAAGYKVVACKIVFPDIQQNEYLSQVQWKLQYGQQNDIDNIAPVRTLNIYHKK